MNLGNECYLVYDKYGGNTHSFKNKLTLKYKIKDLFETKTGNEDGNRYYIGPEAVQQFNLKFGSSVSQMPNNINFDVLSIHMFNFRNEDKCEIIITIVGIYIDVIEKYYKIHNDIPNREFIISSCRFHISYENYGIHENKPEDLVKNIVDKVIVPNPDIMDPTINNPDFIVEPKKLYDYQKRSIRWMYDIETNKKKNTLWS